MKPAVLDVVFGGMRSPSLLSPFCPLVPLAQVYDDFGFPSHPEWDPQPPGAALIGLAVSLAAVLIGLIVLWHGDKKRAAEQERKRARQGNLNRHLWT